MKQQDSRHNRRPYEPAPADQPLQRGERPWPEREVYYLPGETESKELADFVEWYRGLSQGGGAGTGRDYAGARAQDIKQSAEAVMARLRNMDFGTGDDILFVCGEQAERCQACIGGRTDNDEFGKPLRRLLKKGV